MIKDICYRAYEKSIKHERFWLICLIFDYDTKETIDMIGRFYSMNIRSGSYAFESTTDRDDAKSIGRLDEILKETAYGISFNKVYSITIERKSIEPIGQKKKIEDTIVSFNEIIED